MAALLWTLGSACSGGSSSTPPPDTQARTASQDSSYEQKLARLRARQEAACEKVSQVVTTCAVAEARATLSPKELAELDLENTAPRHQAKYMAACIASDMSPRQVKVFERCLADTTCSVFIPCLDEAKPKK